MLQSLLFSIDDPEWPHHRTFPVYTTRIIGSGITEEMGYECVMLQTGKERVREQGELSQRAWQPDLMTQGWTSSNLSALPWPNRCVSIRRSRARLPRPGMCVLSERFRQLSWSWSQEVQFPMASIAHVPWPPFPQLWLGRCLPLGLWEFMCVAFWYIYTLALLQRDLKHLWTTQTHPGAHCLACCQFSVAVNPPSWRKTSAI